MVLNLHSDTGVVMFDFQYKHTVPGAHLYKRVVLRHKSGANPFSDVDDRHKNFEHG